MCYYCYLYETISLWRFLYWKHVYCPKFSWRLCRLQNSCHLHIRVAIPFYIFKISPSFPAGIRDIAAIMCHWYKGPISSFLVSFFSWHNVSVQSGDEILYLSTADFLFWVFSFTQGWMVPTHVFMLGAEEVFPSERMVVRWHPEVSSWLNIMNRAVRGWKLPGKSYKCHGSLGLGKDRGFVLGCSEHSSF